MLLSLFMLLLLLLVLLVVTFFHISLYILYLHSLFHNLKNCIICKFILRK